MKQNIGSALFAGAVGAKKVPAKPVPKQTKPVEKSKGAK